EYCVIITEISKKTDGIISVLKYNHSNCDKIIHVKNKKKEELKKSMGKKFPFLLKPQFIPPTAVKLTEDQLEWRKTGCDFYMYYTLIAITRLRELGYLLNDVFITEIIRITVLNISSNLCKGNERVWASRYIKTVIERNIVHLG
ncbi:hypothetical protein PENTCL1PPCAC_23621, partial [Pristionchus entomophagus]